MRLAVSSTEVNSRCYLRPVDRIFACRVARLYETGPFTIMTTLNTTTLIFELYQCIGIIIGIVPKRGLFVYVRTCANKRILRGRVSQNIHYWRIYVACSQLMRQIMAQYGRPDAQHIAILLTDGDLTNEFDRTEFEAGRAKSESIRIFVIGALRLCLFKYAEYNCQVNIN